MLDEDAAGMLWFVTNNGLHRYDGNQVLTFDMQSIPSLPDININNIFADDHGNLWIGTRRGLVLFNLKSWITKVIHLQDTSSQSSQTQSVTAISEGANGTIYLGSGNGRLYAYSSGKLKFITQIRTPLYDSSANSPAVKTVKRLDNGEIWLTTEKGQVVRILSEKSNPQLIIYEPKALQQSSINFLTFGSSGKCMVYGVNSGAFLLDTLNGSFAPLASPLGLPSLQKGTNYPSVSGNDKVAFFFAGYNEHEKGFGVYDFKTNTFNNLNAIYPSAFKNSIFRKVNYKNKQVYISTDRGIATVSYINNPFQVLLSGLENINSIRTIYKRANDGLYVASYQQKFIKLNEATNEKEQLSDQMVSCLIPWGKDTLLAGTEGDFPNWYFPSTNKLMRVFKENKMVDYPKTNNYVLCLCRESDHLVWVGTYAGCYLLDPVNGSIKKINWSGEGSPLRHSNVYTVLKVGNNRFFATTAGIFNYNVSTGKMHKLFPSDSVYGNASFGCMQVVGNQIWAGTYGNGILVFDTLGIINKKITTADGLSSNIVFSLPISKNYILAGTSNGLSMVDTALGNIRNYSSSHYLPANEFNRSAWFVQNDTVYMGTINGIIRFDASQLAKTTLNRPQLKISNLTISNQNKTKNNYSIAYQTNYPIVIPAGTRSFSISFGGLDDAAAELNLFYRFTNSGTWQQIGQQREITFVNISPDKYTIQIAGRLPDGQWLDNLLNIPVNVQPTFYQTLWFKGILLVLLLTLFWLGIKYREKNLRKEHQLRSRIASDLHDEVGSALTRIYFQAGMLSSEATSNADSSFTPTALQKIAESSQEALSSISDMVWSIDAHFDNANDMIARMRDYIARLQDELECKCTFEVLGNYEKRQLTQVVRQNILLIFKEAVNNAIKYGDEKKVDINATFDDKSFKLSVNNKLQVSKPLNSRVQGGHGLQGMQLRADKIKADLTIDGSNDGFMVSLYVKN